MTTCTYPNRPNGFSLVEMVLAIAAVGLLTVGVGVLLANTQKDWNRLTDRVFSDEVTDSLAIQTVFDRLCRNSSLSKYTVGSNGDSLELYYWDTGSTSSKPENYAYIYQTNDQVSVEYGKLQSGTWQKDSSQATTMALLADGVASLKFVVFGTAIQMYVTFTEPEAIPVICSSDRRNE